MAAFLRSLDTAVTPRLTHRLPCRRVQMQSIDAGYMPTF
jgi:hypothetical protein